MADYMDVTSSMGTAPSGRTERTGETGRSKAGQRGKAAPKQGTTGSAQDPAAVYTRNGVRQTPTGKEPGAGDALSQAIQSAEAEAAALEEELSAQEKEAAEKEEAQERLIEMLERYRENQVSFFERLLKKMQEQRKNYNKNKGTKKLSYNYNRVSGTIMRAKTATQAGLALTSASAALASVRRQAASGQYKSRDVEIALQHAQKMVRVARKKLNNMSQESRQKKNDDRDILFVKRKPKKKKIAAEAKKQQKIFELERELQRRQRKNANANRREELMELTNADMEYLRRRIEALKSDAYQQTSYDSDSFIMSVEGMEASSTASAAEVAEQGMEAGGAEEGMASAEGGAEMASGGGAEA